MGPDGGESQEAMRVFLAVTEWHDSCSDRNVEA